MAKTLSLEQQLIKSYKKDLNKTNQDYYGLSVFEIDGDEYAIGNDEDCDKACEEYIEQSAWAFRASFICDQCSLPYELAEALEMLQSKKCEGCNDAILQMINNSCGIKDFTDSAIQADGRGHYLAQYDGDEMYLGENLYAYRIN